MAHELESPLGDYLINKISLEHFFDSRQEKDKAEHHNTQGQDGGGDYVNFGPAQGAGVLDRSLACNQVRDGNGTD